MPFERDELDRGLPDKPCLAVFSGPGEIITLPVGARMLLIFDPSRPDRVHPVFLAKVSREKLYFRCNCGQGKCTRVFEYALTIKGNHPLSESGV